MSHCPSVFCRGSIAGLCARKCPYKNNRRGTMKLTATPYRLGKGLAALALILSSTSALAKEEWKFQINVNAGDDEFRIAQEWAKSVGEKTNGEILIEVMPTGTIVGNNETLDAVGAGIIQGHITDPGYFSGKNPAF